MGAEEYVLGHIIGEGSFGKVLACCAPSGSLIDSTCGTNHPICKAG